MKKFLFGFALLCALILTSCSSLYSPIGGCEGHVGANCDCTHLLRETWLCQLNLDPNLWTRSADPWFLTGKPNLLECADLHAPLSKLVTQMISRLPCNVVNIQVSGGFQVQIVGGEPQNTVRIIGPHAGARRVAIDMRKSTLFVYETTPTNHAPNNGTGPVIVRITVGALRGITNSGCGHVFGRNILSKGLVINSSGRGDILLAGDMNLLKVSQTNRGSVIVYGANTPNLTIHAFGGGNVNITGHVGIQSIVNRGNGAVRILGADTDCLTIQASGKSLTSVVGYANLRKVKAADCARVYLYWVNACNTQVMEQDYAQVGLAGVTGNLNICLEKHSRFLGRYLHANDVYIMTRGAAHANVYAEHRLFAESLGESSIYYGGRPSEVSPFKSTYGNILPIISNSSCGLSCLLPSGCPRRPRGCF